MKAWDTLTGKASVVRLCYLELDGTVLKLSDIEVFEILRVKYFKNKWLVLVYNFDISIVFEIAVWRYQSSTVNNLIIPTSP